MASSPRPLFTGRVAVVIPCLNEELTVGGVVDAFRAALPEAEIYVFDNASTDRTAEIAQARGATVIAERRPGKGYVVQAMLAKVDADYYLMVDGDATYSAADARRLLQPLMDQQADMTVGTRLEEHGQRSFRALHLAGNRVLTGIVNWVFGAQLRDMLSGYRGMTRELARSVAVLSSGFEVETELTLRALEGGFTIHECPLPYRERPAGSRSKLRTFRDGARVVRSIFDIARTYRPFTFYGVIGLGFAAAGLWAGWLVLIDYLDGYYVHRVPLAVLATGCMILAFVSFSIGLLLNTLSARFREVMRLLRPRSR